MKVCGFMEDQTIVIIIAMIGIFAIIGAKMFNPNQAKSKVKTRKDNAVDTLDKVNDATIERLSKELKKESGRANRLQALKDKWEGNEDEEEEEEEPGKKQVTFEEIQELVKVSYPKYSGLLPVFKGQIMEATKGMSLEEVLQYVKNIKGDQGFGPGDPASVTNEGFNPNYA